MTSSASLSWISRRIDVLVECNKQIARNISRIPRTSDLEELSDVTSSIRLALRTLSTDIDLLSLELKDAGHAQERDDAATEKLRLEVRLQRLADDAKHAKTTFRTMQIYTREAGRNSERKEREERLKSLRSRPSPTSSQVLNPQRQLRNEKPRAHVDVETSASNDVIAALRLTHTLMATELQRSQLAEEILAESTRELEQLQGSYTDLNTMLKQSRGLISQLMKSNKSDTWYLIIARNCLLVVLVWLIWRRWFWGPVWWLVWLPMKLSYMSLSLLLGMFGSRQTSGVSDPYTTVAGVPEIFVASSKDHVASSQTAELLAKQTIEPREYEVKEDGSIHDSNFTQSIEQMLDEADAMNDAYAHESELPIIPEAGREA